MVLQLYFYGKSTTRELSDLRGYHGRHPKVAKGSSDQTAWKHNIGNCDVFLSRLIVAQVCEPPKPVVYENKNPFVIRSQVVHLLFEDGQPELLAYEFYNLQMVLKSSMIHGESFYQTLSNTKSKPLKFIEHSLASSI